MGMFRWVASVFTWCNELIYGDESIKEKGQEPQKREIYERDPCRKRIRTRQKSRGIERRRTKFSHKCPLTKKYIKERLVFDKNLSIKTQDLFEDYISWSVSHGQVARFKQNFFTIFNYYCRNKAIYHSYRGKTNNQAPYYIGVGLKYDHVEEFDELPF